MAHNDIVLLDGIIEQRIADALPSGQLDDVFEYLAFEQILKDYDLSREEIEDGWLDGRNDGGIDGLFVLVNGHLLRDPATFGWPKRNASIEVIIVTAKHHATFLQAPLNSLLATIPELLSLGKETTELKGAYSDDVLGARALFDTAYRKLASISPALSFRFVYASRGDSAQVADNIQARADQLTAQTTSLFSSASASFEFLGATELVRLYRRTKTFSLALPFLEHFARSRDGYVLLTTLGEYCTFVTDDNGQLRRYLFDSNVRDYLGESAVNDDIGASLLDEGGPEFWWLNNGVTILATGATPFGKVMQLQDVQIVNGLQTTESIFRHFQAGAQQSRDRGLLVKVVVSTDTDVRDQIIRATNNQSLVEPQSLRATDKIQRDIEEVLERHDWYYERRKNYYRNIGKPPSRFVTPLFIASGFVALVMRNPEIAMRLRARFMRNPDAYAKVFSEQTPLTVWPIIVEVVKRAEQELTHLRPERGAKRERFLARYRSVLGLFTVARVFGRFDYPVSQLSRLDVTLVTSDLLRDTWGVFTTEQKERTDRWKRSSDDYPKPLRYKKELQFERAVWREVARNLGLPGAERLGREEIATKPEKRAVLTEEFLDFISRKLPPQPWPPNVHVELAQQLGVKSKRVYAAVRELIARGKWPAQRSGGYSASSTTDPAVEPEQS